MIRSCCFKTHSLAHLIDASNEENKFFKYSTVVLHYSNRPCRVFDCVLQLASLDMQIGAALLSFEEHLLIAEWDAKRNDFIGCLLTAE